jgi:hypothetical protein
MNQHHFSARSCQRVDPSIHARLPLQQQLESVHLALVSELLKSNTCAVVTQKHCNTQQLEQQVLLPFISDPNAVSSREMYSTRFEGSAAICSQDFRWVQHLHRLRSLVFDLRLVPIVRVHNAGKSRLFAACTKQSTSWDRCTGLQSVRVHR